MHPYSKIRFPEDFFSTPSTKNLKHRKIALAPICTKQGHKPTFSSAPEEATPYFKPLTKSSSCSELPKSFESPNILNLKLIPPKTINSKKVLLPSLKPQLHSGKHKRNMRSTMALKILNKNLFDSNLKNFGVTFSKNSPISSFGSQNSGIFVSK